MLWLIKLFRKIWGPPRQPPGAYPSERVWTVAVEIKDELGSFMYYRDYAEDYLRGYILSDEGIWDRAEWNAKEAAESIRKTGVKTLPSNFVSTEHGFAAGRVRETHYPVHRIKKVEVTSEENEEYEEWTP